MVMAFTCLFLALNSPISSAEEIPRPHCDVRNVLRYFDLSDEKKLSSESKDKLVRVGESPLTLRTLNGNKNAFQDLYDRISQFNQNAEKEFSVEDATFRGHLRISRKSKTLKVEILSINIKDMDFGKNPKGVNTAFFKFVGGVLNGVDENISRHAGEISRVKIVGSSVINRKLEKSLAELGFRNAGHDWRGMLIKSKKGFPGAIKGSAKLVASSYLIPEGLVRDAYQAVTIPKAAFPALRFITGQGSGHSWILDLSVADPEVATGLEDLGK
jgi:hypothetical protein